MTADTTTAPERDDRPHGWLIHKAGRGWYRPMAKGYTGHICEAGRYSHEEALSYSHPNGWDGPRDNITIRHESEVLSADPCRAPVAQDAEPVAWESTTLGYKKFVSDRIYQGFSEKAQRWYKPHRCSACATAPQPSDEAATLRAQLAEALKRIETLTQQRDQSATDHGRAVDSMDALLERAEAAEVALKAAEDHADVLAEAGERLIKNLTEGDFISATREDEWQSALAAHQARRAGELGP